MARKSIEAANAALKAHEDMLGVEGDTEIQVWHLIVSLQDLCRVQGIDFDEQVADATRYNRYEAAET